MVKLKKKAYIMNYLKTIFRPSFIRPSLLTLLLINPLFATQYEDAEDKKTSGWVVYDNTPSGATITNIMDNQKNSRVIQLKGKGRLNSYALGAKSGNRAWNDTDAKTLQWSMNVEGKYKLYIYIDTTDGLRYLYYSYHDKDKGLISHKYVHHGLGRDSKDGEWHTYTRDLEKDLKKYEPNNSIVAVNGFRFQGDAKIDDISLLSDNDNADDNNNQHDNDNDNADDNNNQHDNDNDNADDNNNQHDNDNDNADDNNNQHDGSQLIVPKDYKTLRDAVAHAKDGDTIILNPGTYYISDIIKVKQKNLTVASKYYTTGDKSYVDRTVIKGVGYKNSKRFLEAESKDLRFIGISGENFGKFIVFQYGNKNLVDHCKLTNIDGDAVSFDATSGGKVLHTFIDLAGDDAIDVDSKVQGEFEFAYNTILHSHDDGIEIHLWKDKRHKIVNTMHYNIHDNVINFSHKDAIQLIDYKDTTNRTFNISNNTFSHNGHVAIGAILKKTNHSLPSTNFSGTDMKEKVEIFNNLFDGNRYHILGGSNMKVKGNTFKNASKVAIKRVKGKSVIKNNVFLNNKVNRLDSN